MIPPLSIGSDIWPGAHKLAEECAELQQVLAKLGAFPDGDHPDGTDLRIRLHHELGDVQAALEYFIWANPLEIDRIPLRMRREGKVDRFMRWHREEREEAA
jgi:hypothetical protein